MYPITEVPNVPGPIDVLFCDVDNVLAPANWRMQFVERHNKDEMAKWQNFHAASPCDRPNTAMVDWVSRMLDSKAEVHFLTAMPEKFRPLREWWLAEQCGFEKPSVLMRPNDDYSPSGVLKPEIIRTHFGLPPTDEPEPMPEVLVVDDHTHVLLAAASLLRVSTAYYAIEKRVDL